MSRLRSLAARLIKTHGRDYDRQTVAVMKAVLGPSANCIDIGACSGELLKHIVRLAPRGTHLAFEPLPRFYNALIRKFPGVQVHELALSDATGESTFQHVFTNPAYSGLKPRRYDRPNERVEEIMVRTGRLDDLVPPDMPVRFIKIDVEGGELQVFKGGAVTIRRTRPFIVFEFGLGAADWYGTQPEDIYRMLSDCRLQVSLISDWLAGRAALSEPEFEVEFRECRNYYFLAHPPVLD